MKIIVELHLDESQWVNGDRPKRLEALCFYLQDMAGGAVEQIIWYRNDGDHPDYEVTTTLVRDADGNSGEEDAKNVARYKWLRQAMPQQINAINQLEEADWDFAIDCAMAADTEYQRTLLNNKKKG